jgi:NADPH:quinone reductase-like Zn-dependent oxidoreductase
MWVAGIEREGDAVTMLEVPGPRAPGEGEVLISVRAAGVGNWDDVVRVGGWDVGRTAPMALGVEAAGIVAIVGAGVDGWVEGDEVLTHPVPLVDQGAWAPWLVAPAAQLSRKPPTLAWELAGAFPVPALTATQALGALDLAAGDRLLVSGAGSVTGGLIVSLAAVRGIEVLATAGPSSRERVSWAGATTIVDHHDANWPAQILEATAGRGVDAAANAVRAGAARALAAIRDAGRLVTITSDPPAAERGIAIESLYVHPDAAQLEEACGALAAGRLPFVLGATFPLADAATALARAVAGLGGAVALEL